MGRDDSSTVSGGRRRPTAAVFPGAVFECSVDTLVVDGKSIDLGYLRSPSGVLVELFSVRLATRR